METLGLESFKLFADYKMACSLEHMFFRRGVVTNAYGDVFWMNLSIFPKYADSFR
jgi:NHS family xanthosine MFS transporter